MSEIVPMSGQPDDSLIETAFLAFMEMFDQVFADDSPFSVEFPDSFLEWHRKSGELDWHEFYRLDIFGLHKELMDAYGREFGLPEAGKQVTMEDSLASWERVKSMIESDKMPNERKLVKKAQMHGVRWMLLARSTRVWWTCLVQYEIGMNELMEMAEQGDKDAFLKLARLDATILAAPFARRILNDSELKLDWKFRRDLARSLVVPKGFWTLEGKKRKRDMLALWLLGELGYEDRPYREWADILSAHDFKNFESEQNVAKACKRYGIAKKHPKRRKNLDS